jgi:hypothetical protein
MTWLRAALLILVAGAICEALAGYSEDWGTGFEGAPLQPSTTTTTSAPGTGE